MVINKLFGKKDSSKDINSLKERFSQVSGSGQTPSQPDAQTQPSQQEAPVTSNQTVQVQDAIPPESDQPSVQSQPPMQSSQPVAQPFGQQPLGMASSQFPAQPPAQQVSQPAPQQAPVAQAPVQQPVSQAQPPVQQSVPQPLPVPSPAPATSMSELPSWAVESAGEEIGQQIGQSIGQEGSNQNKAQETLEQIEDKFYDAKLNSLIIDQVKELIEIDNNLNQRIDDLSSETKKEVSEREKLAKTVESHFEKLKELEKNMEKFLGLYEMVTNQFNPFVDKGSADLFLSEEDKKYANVAIEDPKPLNDTLNLAADEKENPIPAELRPASQPAPQQAPVQQPVSQAQPPVQQSVSQPVQPQQSSGSTEWRYCPIHHNIHPSLHFELKNGQKLSSIYDVLSVLETMDDETFSHHVNLRQNDLSTWIYRVLGLTDLSQQLDLIKTRPEMIQSIRSYIQEKMRSANQK